MYSFSVCVCAIEGCIMTSPEPGPIPSWPLSTANLSIHLLFLSSPSLRVPFFLLNGGRLCGFMTLPDWSLWSIFCGGLHLPLFTSFCPLFLAVSVPEAWLRLPCAHQTGWGEMIWLMRIASLSIHGYFLESIRPIWLIQVVALIKGLPLSLHFHFSIALAFHFHWIRSLSSLLPSVRPSCTHFTTTCFSWLEETDHTHLAPPSSVSYAGEGWAMVIHYRFGKEWMIPHSRKSRRTVFGRACESFCFDFSVNWFK